MKRNILILLFLLSITVLAQSKNVVVSGNLNLDSKNYLTNNSIVGDTINLNLKRSPLMAATYSMLLPGAGQFYNKNYIKAGVFFLVEAIAIGSSIVYNNKGDDQTGVFEDFALNNWDVTQYAKWSLNFAVNNGIVNQSDYVNLFNNGNVNWGVLNNLEDEISRTNVGKYYSHRLAPFREQQYFEMIGKYPQFNPGWNDFGDENTPFSYGDPVTEKFNKYTGMRGEANDYFSIAKTAVIIVFVNHAVSAIEAALYTRSYNKKIDLKLNVKNDHIGFLRISYPELKMRINL